MELLPSYSSQTLEPFDLPEDETPAPSPSSYTSSTPSSSTTASSSLPTSSDSSSVNTPNSKSSKLPQPYFAAQFNFRAKFANPGTSVNSTKIYFDGQQDMVAGRWQTPESSTSANGCQQGSILPDSTIPSHFETNMYPETNHLVEASGEVTEYHGAEYFHSRAQALPSFELYPAYPTVGTSHSNTGSISALASPPTATTIPQRPIARPSRHSKKVKAIKRPKQTPYSRPAKKGKKVACQWAGCIAEIQTDDIPSHLSVFHGVVKGDDETVKIPCLWQGCSLEIQRGSMRRHVQSVHCQALVQICQGCGTEFSRSDSLKRHKCV
ncbi:hypothetical protein JAAARDRAFT_42121 [Jaapia argillacea MUCL 33604]|uniref:C2H2-type domain-containing protein n=1 Tax=Jaapia argillacea MUCL 33604 TaxID=933084 RepID=A0A067P6F9_9AGAM|nr:hypothetical protein JAAARDRAFT_42121 [Jaapia argillacea MUCL 33604]